MASITKVGPSNYRVRWRDGGRGSRGRSRTVHSLKVAKELARDVEAGTLRVEDIDEACVSSHLYLPDLPDPDLLIRTSGELRISNFMLWQLSYAEIVAPPALWPDFRKPDLHAAIAEYQARQRRFGGRSAGTP